MRMDDSPPTNTPPTERSPDFVVRPIHGLIRSKARIDNADGACLARVVDRGDTARAKVFQIVPTDDNGNPDRTRPLLSVRTTDSMLYELLMPDGEAFGVVERVSGAVPIGGEHLMIRTAPDHEMTEIRETGHLWAALGSLVSVLAPVPVGLAKREFEVITNHRVATLTKRTGISGLRVEVYLEEPDPRIDTLTLLAAACILREFLV